MAGMWPFLLYALLALNLVTFLAFGWDKRRAKRNVRRTPEATLLTLSWLGGFPGGWVGMNLFRHKTKKLSFKLKMVAVTILNPAWLILWLWLDGRI